MAPCGHKKCTVCGYSTGLATYSACSQHRCSARGCGLASGKAKGINYSKFCGHHEGGGSSARGCGLASGKAKGINNSKFCVVKATSVVKYSKVCSRQVMTVVTSHGGSSSRSGGGGGGNKSCTVCGYSTGLTTYSACSGHRCSARGCGLASGKAKGINYSKFCGRHQGGCK